MQENSKLKTDSELSTPPHSPVACFLTMNAGSMHGQDPESGPDSTSSAPQHHICPPLSHFKPPSRGPDATDEIQSGWPLSVQAPLSAASQQTRPPNPTDPAQQANDRHLKTTGTPICCQQTRPPALKINSQTSTPRSVTEEASLPWITNPFFERGADGSAAAQPQTACMPEPLEAKVDDLSNQGNRSMQGRELLAKASRKPAQVVRWMVDLVLWLCAMVCAVLHATVYAVVQWCLLSCMQWCLLLCMQWCLLSCMKWCLLSCMKWYVASVVARSGALCVM